MNPIRWARVGPEAVWSGLALVLVAWGLMAINRLGGLTFDAPRAFLRLTVVGVWGWLGLALAIWLVAGRASSLRRVLAVTGWVHVPVVGLAVLIFVVAGAFEVLGPGLIGAIVVFGVLIPSALVLGAEEVFGLERLRAVAVVSIPYLAWTVLVVRHVLGQVGHLL